jgi:ABC-type branched-subunit amino acid transport system substrate-binding protein
MARNIERRDVLKGIGGAGIAGFAGCISQSGGDGDGDGDSTGSETETGTGGGGGGGSSGDFTAKLGVLLPLTGDLASVGKPIRDAAILPKKVIEAGDAPISIDQSVEDTQTDPQAAVNTANSLVNSGYPMVTGPASSGVNMQVTQEAFIPNNVVGCSPSSTSPNVTGLDDNDLVFRTAPSDALQGQVMAQVGADELGAQSTSVMFVNNDYGQALTDAFVNAFGGDVGAEVAFRKEKGSYTSELSEAMNSSPDMLVVIGYPASGIQIFRDFYAEYGTDTDILVTDGLQDGTLPDKVGNDMENVYGTAPNPSGPGNEAFTQQYQDEYDTAPGVFNAHAYDASAVLLLAAAAAGENDGGAIKEQLRNVANPGGTEVSPENLVEGITMAANGEEIQYVGASSSVDFDDKGDMKAVAYSYWKFNTDQDSNIESLKTIEFGGDS